jgi:CRISPR-associated protein Cas1
MGSTAAILRRQLEATERPEGLAIACEWVLAKLRQQAEFLEELARRRMSQRGLFDAPLATIRSILAQVAGLAGTLDEERNRLVGLDGSAGRVRVRRCCSRSSLGRSGIALGPTCGM